MLKRAVLLVVLVLSAVAFLVPVATAQTENILTVGMFTDPPRLDPAEVSSYEEGIVTYNVYEVLLQYNLETWDILPKLATSWEISEDATEAVFTLREGVKFHDGTDFNAEAVKFSFDRTVAIGRAPAAYLSGITSVEVLGPLSIKFTTSETWAFWEDVFACPKALPIISPTSVQLHKTDDDPWAAEWVNENPCGTGAYQVIEWKHGEYVRLDRFPDYWRGWTDKNFDTVMVMVVREPAKQKLFFERGALDIPYAIPVSYYPALAEDPGVKLVPVTGLAQRFITMKADRPPLDNKYLRQAIAYAIDYESAVQLRPYAKVAQGPIPSHALGFNESLEVSHQDLAKARELMEASGYAPGEIELEMVYVAGLDYQRNLAVLVQSNLAEIGINVKLTSMPWSTLWPLLADPDKAPPMYIYYAAAQFGDPHGILWQMFHPDALGPAGQNNGYNNPEVGRLLDLAETTVNRDARAALYRQVSEIIAEDQPAIFLWEVPYPQIYRADLQNVAPDGLFRTYYFYEIYRK